VKAQYCEADELKIRQAQNYLKKALQEY